MNNKILFIGIHILIGILCVFIDFFSSIYTLAVLIISIGIVATSNNKNEEALLLSAYIVGAEVFFRMTKGAPLYETGKYSVILLLTLGMMVGPVKQKLSFGFVFYLMLLLLGIVFTEVPESESIRRAVAFNLSGPFMLGVCALYFYKRKIKINELFNSFFLALLPIISMTIYISFVTPDFSDIQFGGVSLGETSGGFGPNQVATILGFGAFLISTFLIIRRRFFGFLALDFILLIFITYRGLLTFSRGGIITGAIALAIFALLYFKYVGSFQKVMQYVLIAAVCVVGIWIYTSQVTDGAIYNRYTNRNASGIKKEDATAGRLRLIEIQLQTFVNSPLFGIGVGNGKYKRLSEVEEVTAASHNELTRLIEEHGFLGLIMLLLLFITPLLHFFGKSSFELSFLLAFLAFWFLTINHSAMRIAFPGFIYGLSLINLTYQDD